MSYHIPTNFKEAVANNPHLESYVRAWKKKTGRIPQFQPQLSKDLKTADQVSVIYPVGDPVFIHVHGIPGEEMLYSAIEPEMDDAWRETYAEVRDQILQLAPYEDAPETNEQLRAILDKLYDQVVKVSDDGIPDSGSNGDGHDGEEEGSKNGKGGLSKFINFNFTGGGKVKLTQEQYNTIQYYLHRDIVEHGPLEPIIRDPYIEDIHAIGLEPVHHIHKVFDMMETNVTFRHAKELDDFLRTMGERIGRPVSESRPIVDATLPDGSRINIIYSDDVSLKGSSFTIRKFAEDPLSLPQIIKWGTMSAHTGAYLWLCLEHGQSVFVCGETASGKTTTLNGILPFIQPSKKVFTAEDTPEVRPPQPAWQQLSTREQGPEEARVTMFDLLKAALRSRPNYIIVGEIRGAEGNVAFQAMQTGHPVIATFHASSVAKMIQRLTADPINVPKTFMDNLNVCLVQMAVYHQGKMLRRVLAVEEIEGYSDHAGGVLTRGVFQWDPTHDDVQFRGRNNSYILEERIATTAGYTDKKEIYKDLDMRARIIERMIELDILDYYEVKDLIWKFYREGVKGLPFTL